MHRLTDRVAVITGGSRGIGKAIAMDLAREGCKTVIAARNRDELKQAEQGISKLNRDVLSVEADVRRVNDVKSLVQSVEKRFGSADILVNNAGIGRFQEVLKMEEEDLHAIFETNLFGTFYCTKYFLPGMIEKQRGHVINIGSLAGKNNFAGGSAYCASKHALLSFAECLMLEVRHNNIKVTTICPGSVQTDFSETSKEHSWALTPEDVSKCVLDALTFSPGSLVSLMELRPLKPPQKKNT
jgi:NAD(P)-dependent dehydrogenase (short-subunit alcohol dehydrogenase family)